MRIILHYLLKSILESKFRTFLIVLSISLSCALFFASNAFAMTFTRMFTERLKQYYGNADIIIHSNERSPSYYFTTHRTKAVRDDVEYIIGSIDSTGSYYPTRTESRRISIRGFNYEDLNHISPVVLMEQTDLLPFEGNKVIINRLFAEKYNLKTGDIIELKVEENKYKLKIVAVALPEGFLKDNPRQATFIVPLKKMARVVWAKGRVNTIYVKVKNPDEKQQVINELAAIYNRYDVREPINQAEFIQEMQSVTVPFMLMTILVLCISVFIIYTSFKVITMERLPIIGTFRSVGATKKTTDIILLLESLTYGVIGGIIGLLLGLLILYGMATVMSYDSWSGTKMKVVMRFSTFHVVASLLLAVLLSFISSLAPIIKISKIPIKDIVLNKLDTKIKKKRWTIYTGILLIAGSLIIPRFMPSQLALIADSLCLILLVTGVIFLIPLITTGFVKLFERIYAHIFGNEGIIAVKNLRDNKSILNNISLLAIGIAGVLMINVISYSVDIEILSFYKSANFQIWSWIWKGDRNTELIIRSIKGVKQTYGVYETNDIEIDGSDQKIRVVSGIKEKYLDYWDVEVTKDQIKHLHEGRYMLMTTSLKEILKVKKGDVIPLKLGKGKKNYKIIGFFDSLRNNGSYCLISNKYYRLDMQSRYYNDIFIKTLPGFDTGQVIQKVKKKLARRQPWMMSVTDLEKNDKAETGQILFILKAFSVLTMVIGIFGVLNNLIVNFIQRKRSLAMYRSIGMSKVQIIKMIFIESLSAGLIGGIIGAVTGLVFLIIIREILKAINVGIALHFSPVHPLVAALAGMLITVIASISPAVRTSKMNIIEAIKYE